MGGNIYSIEIEQTGVECWEQQVSASESSDFEKRGITATTKLYFVSDPGVTEQHRILITERNGVEAPNLDMTDVNNPDVLDVVSNAQPDASAGLGILFRIMCKNSTGGNQ